MYKLLSPSRNSSASCTPVEAPEGTAALKIPRWKGRRDLEGLTFISSKSWQIHTFWGCHFHLDGGVSTGVVDLTGVNLSIGGGGGIG